MSNCLPIEIQVRFPLQPFMFEFDGALNERVTGLFGPSGSGKTSLIETVAGLRQNVVGKIKCGNLVWQDSNRRLFVPPEKRGIGYVPQNTLLFPHRSVRQNVLYGTGRAKLDTDLFERSVDSLGLSSLLDRKPHSLSGGERQRVAIGRAVCSSPKLLILDEPLSALHHSMKYATLTFLSRFSRETHIPMLWVSHDPVEVQAVCDELIVIDAGRLVTRGTPRDVLTNPDVFQTFEHTGFQNVLQGAVVSTTRHEAVVQISDRHDGAKLFVSTTDKSARVNDNVVVTIPARSILLASRNPDQISARNVIEGTVLRTDQLSPGIVAVQVQLGDRFATQPLTAEITDVACKKLSLQPDQSVYVLIKSAACMMQPANTIQD